MSERLERLADSVRPKQQRGDMMAMPNVSVRIWFDWLGNDHHEMWWKPIPFIPPLGMTVVPFSDDVGDRLIGGGWEFEHDDITVDGYTFLADSSVLVVSTVNKLSDNSIPIGFDEAMKQTGWVKGDSQLWEQAEK